MTAPASFTPETQALISRLYLEGVPPREIEARLRDDLKIQIKAPALRQWLKRRGLTKERRKVEAAVMATVDPAEIARARAEKVQGHLDRWAEKAAVVVDRALDVAATAPSIRDVAVATGAAAQGLRMVQTCTGVGGPTSRTTVDVAFATSAESPFNPASRARAVVAVTVEPAEAE